MVVKCATIGTVQEKSPSVPRKVFIHGPGSLFQGQTSGNQAPGRQQLDAKQSALRQRGAIVQVAWMNPSGL
jgi:hypothetical protein